jgi:hypothetical protein
MLYCTAMPGLDHSKLTPQGKLLFAHRYAT